MPERVRIWSILAIIAFAISANTVINTNRIFEKKYTLVRYDQGGYFAYLPAVFIYGDLTFEFYKEQRLISKEFLRKHRGIIVDKYSVGPALLLTPFFGIGHLEAGLSEVYPQDGFSKPYKHWLLLGCIFYVSLGFFLLRAVLLRYFPDVVVALVILGIGLGTNLLYYSTNEGMMSHAYSFFLFSLVLFAGVRYWSSEAWGWMVLLGLGSGLILLTRIPNGLFLLVPALWGVTSRQSLQERLRWVGRKPFHLALGLTLMLLAFSPQLIYWKVATGDWWVDTYRGEHFFLTQPLIDRILFSFRKGWLIYTPIMSLSLLGFFFLKKYAREAFWAVFLFFVVNLYMVSTWGVWWFGGGFGMRALIESMAPLSIPMAAAIYHINRILWGKILFSLFFTACICLNLFQTYQYGKGVIHHDAMTWGAYKAVWGVLHPAPREAMKERDKHLDHPHYGKANEDRDYRSSMP